VEDIVMRRTHGCKLWLSNIYSQPYNNCFKLPQDGIICVASLGCSCGANTFNVGNIISIGFCTNGALEIQYFFNDLPTYDFNVLLQQLSPLDPMLGGNQNIDACSPPLK
jgi:hypothetical protein